MCRKVARQVVKDKKQGTASALDINAKMIPKFLGVPKFRLGKKDEKGDWLFPVKGALDLNDHFLPALSVDPSTGVVEAGFYSTAANQSGQFARRMSSLVRSCQATATSKAEYIRK